ncbi:MAG TPA: hypothetical protein VHU91_02980, partial [Mycobacteriales bacterium]|nr:hypothetical protein [Mycobacteriales bacterium]
MAPAPNAQPTYRQASDTNQLMTEIALVRRRGIARIETHDPRRTPLDLPVLAELGERYAPGKSLTEAVKGLVTSAIETLPDGLTRTTAIRLYGLDRDGFYAPTPGQWRKEACILNATSDENFRKSIESNLVAHLARAMFTITAETRQGASVEQSSPVGTCGTPGFIASYIWRTEHGDAFDQLLEQGHDTILLLGQTGMGKSRLADDLVYRHATNPEEVVWLRRVTENTYLRDLHAACAQRGIATPHSDEHKMLLAALVQSEHAPEFVVIDAVTWADDLKKMLPTATHSTIVAVSWAKTTDLKRCGIIRVGPFTDEQTRQLLTLRSPRLSDSDRDLLQACLYGHPAVIASVCELINSGALTAHDVHTALAQGAPEFLSHINVGRKYTLGGNLQTLTRELETHHPLAAELL